MTASPASGAPRRIWFGHDPRALLAVFLGGAVGALVRAITDDLLPATPGTWPWATFAVNVAGAAGLAATITLVHERLPYRRLLLGTGLCGGLTTFSTMQIELLELLRRSEFALAVGYLTASLAAGLAVAHAVTRVIHALQDRHS